MLKQEMENRSQMEFFCVDEFVPQGHLLRKIDKTVDFSHIYDLVEELYCPDNGRPSCDPVVLFKMVIIQHLYGIPSLRRTVDEISMNVAYRWFLGYTMAEKIPHFATISYNFKHRFTEQTIEDVFHWVLAEIASQDMLSPEAVFIDGTHIKASANMKKRIKKEVPVAAKKYEKQLMEEIDEDREDHGKKPFSDDDNEPPKTKTVTESTTDPECGVFHKGEHKKQFAYEAHTACDKNGYILDVEVTAGNVHDSVAFELYYDRLIEEFPQIEYVVMDAGYKTPAIARKVLESKKIPVLPYKRPNGKDGYFKPYEYIYDEFYDCVICPENQVLKYSTTNRDGYKEFKSCPQICEKCPSLVKCTHSKKHQKTVLKHIWMDYMELVEDIRQTIGVKQLYDKRKETIERCFADAKEKHGMRYTLVRSLSQVTK
jgi:transposase